MPDDAQAHTCMSPGYDDVWVRDLIASQIAIAAQSRAAEDAISHSQNVFLRPAQAGMEVLQYKAGLM